MKSTTVGFTGTRRGLTPAQRSALRPLLTDLGAEILIHGDCVGADAAAHQIAMDAGLRIHIRPCDLPNMRAHCGGAELTFPVTNAFARNRQIVDDCDVLVGTPHTAAEQSRGGTWYTIRYGRKKGRPLFILNPDGTVLREGPPVQLPFSPQEDA